MEIITILLILVLGVALVGGFAGAIVYYNKFKAVSLKLKEFATFITTAFSDKKIDATEKEAILLKIEELTPLIKEILSDISKDAADLDTNFTNFVEKIKVILSKKK
jgi:uncharacterized membrane protein